jgi:aromatic-L-amino-acid decarboxylase
MDGPQNPDGPASEWEWSADEIKRVGYQVVDLIAEHLTTLPDRPVFRPFPQELAASFLDSPPPAAGQTPDEVLAAFKSEIEPYPFGNGHPGFYGWVNSPPTVMGIFAEALAAAMNPSCAGGNHSAIYVERQVTNWFKQILGFPVESMGLLVSGGSMAALTALAVARHAKCGFDVRSLGLRHSPSRLIFYKGQEGHGCHQKALELLGIGSSNLRIVEQDRCLRMSPESLDKQIADDLREGHVPIAVIATAGTVNTGAIDPLDEIADVCARHNVWLHVDGAYGAPAVLARSYHEQLSALSRADSLALDPHKWLYIPVEAGLVLVRDAQAMRAAFSLVPPYLRTDGKADGVGGLPWLSEYGFQQTRGFRALKIWMALCHHGVDGYRASIERDISLAQFLADKIRSSGDFDLIEPQSLSIVCFRHIGTDAEKRPEQSSLDHKPDMAASRLGGPAGSVNAGEARTADLDSLNKAILERTQLEGRVFLSGTVVEGRFWLRACVVNPRASQADMRTIIEVVTQAARRLISA